jgi:enoyl-CoA hydratase/carnithine racemase
MPTEIRYSEKDEVAYITLFEENKRRPPTIDFTVLDELEEKLNIVDKKILKIKALVLQSSSEKYFCAGANINAVKELTPEKFIKWCKIGHLIFNRFQTLAIPTIAMVKGYALGGGLEIAMSCDLIFATKDSHFGQPEASLGLIPGWGGTYRLPQRIGIVKAKELIFTSKIITADQALQLGLINDIYPNDKADDKLREFTNEIKKNSKLALAYAKQILNFDSIADMERERFIEANSAAICLNSESTKERMERFFSKPK